MAGTFGPRFAVAPSSLPGVAHWYNRGLGITLTSGKASRVADQVGSIDWLDTVGSGTRQFSYLDQPLLDGGKEIVSPTSLGMETVDSDAADAAAGWNLTFPFTILAFARVSYTTGNPSELFRNTVAGFGNRPQIFRRSNAAGSCTFANEMDSSGGNLCLNGSGDTNINYNETTGANLVAGETTPYQLLTFEFGVSTWKFYKNGVEKASNSVGSPQRMTGEQIRFATSSPNFAFSDLIVLDNQGITTSIHNDLIGWLNSEYGKSIPTV